LKNLFAIAKEAQLLRLLCLTKTMFLLEGGSVTMSKGAKGFKYGKIVVVI